MNNHSRYAAKSTALLRLWEPAQGGFELKRVRLRGQQPSPPGLPASLDYDLSAFEKTCRWLGTESASEYRSLVAAPNCRVQSKTSREAIQFVSYDFPALADLVELPEALAKMFDPCPIHTPGTANAKSPLTALDPDVVKTLNFDQLKPTAWRRVARS